MEDLIIGILCMIGIGAIIIVFYQLFWKVAEKEIISKTQTTQKPIVTQSSNVFFTKFLRNISMINSICGLIIGLMIWYYIADNMYNGEFLGFIAGGVFFLLTLITTASIMIFVEMSENIAKNKQNTDKILEILNDKK